MDFSKIDRILDATYRESEYPVCQAQTKLWGELRPLAGLTVLDATPIFRNTMVKYRALIAAGARLIVGRAESFPCNPDIVALLQESGVPVVTSREVQSEPVDVVLDCAASFMHWQPRLGVVELTRSGVPRYADSATGVFVADGGRIKRIETCLGTGESYFRAMAQLGYHQWEGRTVVIFGSGKVGFGLLMYAKRKGTRAIVVTEPETATATIRDLADKLVDCHDVCAVAEAVQDAYAVVTATGIAGALAHPTIVEALLQSPALIANMGVEDEFGPALPAERVLLRKQTINFILEEPTHLKYIDATMGLHNEGARYLTEHPQTHGLIEPPAELEEHLLDITRQHGCIGNEIHLI